MKKIIFFGFVYALFLFAFLFLNVTKNYADISGNNCTCDAGQNPTGFSCNLTGSGTKHASCHPGTGTCINTPNVDAHGYYSQTDFGVENPLPETVRVNGVDCRQPQEIGTVYNCSCRSNYSNGNGNGIKCNNDSIPGLFCDKSALACIDDINATTTISKLPYGSVAKGIRCEEPKIAKNCHCLHPGETGSKNDFACSYAAGKTDDMHGFCTNNLACNAGSSSDFYTQANWDGSGRTEVAQGIKCLAPVVKKTGPSCRTSDKQPSQNVSCQTGYTCDKSDDKSVTCLTYGTCTGVCIKPCGVYAGGPTNGGCATNEVCNLTAYSSGYGGNGFCLATSNNRVDVGGVCTSSSTFGGANAAQGNCFDGLVCNTGGNKACDSTAGGCQGRCFPSPYTCNKTYDSRTSTQPSIRQYDCPIGFTCTESQNRKPALVSTNQNIKTCPGCLFSCAVTDDVTVTCACDNRPDSAANVGSGKNGFLCSSVERGSKHSACEPRQGCYDDEPNATMNQSQTFDGATLHGIQCLTPDQKHPPAPPCKTFEFPNGTSDDPNNHGKCLAIASSFGDVGTDPGAFITRLFGILLGISGAIALLLIMRAGYRIMSSRGNPEGIQQGREQLVAAIVGLIFLIFSFVLLQVIGVDLLRIPGNTTSSACAAAGGTCRSSATCAAGSILGRSDCTGSSEVVCCK